MKYLILSCILVVSVSSQTSSQSQATSSVAPSTRQVSPSTPNPTPPSKSSSAHKPTSSGVAPHSTKSHHGMSSKKPLPPTATSTRHVSSSTPNPTPPSKSSSAHKPTNSGVAPHSTKSHHGSTSHVSPTPHSSQVPTSSPTMKPTTKPITKPTTPKPTTTPEPTVDFRFPHGNATCVAVHGYIKLNVTYRNEHSTHVLTGKATDVTGHCRNGTEDTSSIDAKWGKKYEIGMKFSFTEHKWYMSMLNITVNDMLGSIDAFGNYTMESNGNLYQGPVDHSYLCNTTKQLTLRGVMANTSVKVMFDQLQIQPFAAEGKPFQKFVSCISSDGNGGNNSNNIVPIAVGCALAGLIVIVLIAYLIGRRKSNKGYQQV